MNVSLHTYLIYKHIDFSVFAYIHIGILNSIHMYMHTYIHDANILTCIDLCVYQPICKHNYIFMQVYLHKYR